MSKTPRGSALLVTLGVLSVLALIAFSFATMSRVERAATMNYVDEVRARMHAQSGLERCINEIRGTLVADTSTIPDQFYSAALGMEGGWTYFGDLESSTPGTRLNNPKASRLEERRTASATSQLPRPRPAGPGRTPSMKRRSFSSLMRSAPPSPVVTHLPRPKLKTPRWPRLPSGRDRSLAPKACAASSINSAPLSRTQSMSSMREG